MRSFASLRRKAYRRSHGVSPSDISQATWQKSSFSNLNGNCVEVSYLKRDRIGLRDTKDNSAGPVLVFTQGEWWAFLAGAKDGQFDHLR